MYGIKQQHIILSDFISSPQGLGFRVDHNQPSEFYHKAAQQNLKGVRTQRKQRRKWNMKQAKYENREKDK
jgi:hypothetical protein